MRSDKYHTRCTLDLDYVVRRCFSKENDAETRVVRSQLHSKSADRGASLRDTHLDRNFRQGDVTLMAEDRPWYESMTVVARGADAAVW